MRPPVIDPLHVFTLFFLLCFSFYCFFSFFPPVWYREGCGKKHAVPIYFEIYFLNFLSLWLFIIDNVHVPLWREEM